MERSTRNRTLQLLGLGILTVAMVIPMSRSNPEWSGLTDQEREMQQAWRNMQETPTIASEPAPEIGASESVEQHVAEAPAVQTTVARRRRSVIAATPEIEEEPADEETVGPSHYMLRDREVMRAIAQMDLED